MIETRMEINDLKLIELAISLTFLLRSNTMNINQMFSNPLVLPIILKINIFWGNHFQF